MYFHRLDIKETAIYYISPPPKNEPQKVQSEQNEFFRLSWNIENDFLTNEFMTVIIKYVFLYGSERLPKYNFFRERKG